MDGETMNLTKMNRRIRGCYSRNRIEILEMTFSVVSTILALALGFAFISLIGG